MEQAAEAVRVSEVGEIDEQGRGGIVPVRQKMIDARGIEAARAALDAVNFVALLEQQLGEIRAVLARDTGDECRRNSARLIQGAAASGPLGIYS